MKHITQYVSGIFGEIWWCYPMGVYDGEMKGIQTIIDKTVTS